MVEHPVVDAKAKKYDRQLRIWGAHGQAALESAKICLINSGTTGSETLKNLVLGGIAAFTIVDGAKVEAGDLGNNFLLEAANLGAPRAQSVTGLLKELNEAVTGSFVEESAEDLIDGNPAFFRGFDIVVATQMREASLLKLESICRESGVKLLIVRSYGLVGQLRASLGEHVVVESKPDNAVEDLRLHQPWPELAQYAHSLNLADLDEITHKHVPYAVLLIQAAAQWYEEHAHQRPASYKERSDFKLLIKSGQRQIDGCPIDEENFAEAVANAHKVWAPPPFPSEVHAILEDKAITSLSRSSSDFWVLAAALKKFVDTEGGGNLPLEGSIPDMTATTALYLQLHTLYRERAERDVAAVEAHVHTLLRSVGRDPKAIPRSTVKNFCKNARNLRVIRYRTLAEEVGTDTCKSDALRQAMSAEDTVSNATLYLLLRAVDRFHSTYNRFPGSYDGELEEDVPLLKTIALGILAECGAGNNTPISDDLVGEMCRFGGGELHCVAAVMGGIASQEAIKLLTKQFVPLSGTLVYNAMGSTTSVFQL